MLNPAPQAFLQALSRLGVLGPEQIKEIETASVTSAAGPEEIIRRRHLLDEITLAKVKAEASGIPFVLLKGKSVSADIVALLPEAVVRAYTVLPFDYDAKENFVLTAMNDPANVDLVDFLERKTGRKIKPHYALENDIKEKIEESYTRNLSEEVTMALAETSTPKVKTIEASKIKDIIREAPVAKIVSTILEYALKFRASDVHIEPLENRSRVRYRVDGILQEKLALPKMLHDAVISRIKILSDMKIDERRVPQDGRFNFKMGELEVDLRISSLPVVHGEKIVMRLLKKSGGIPSLPELGLRGAALNNLEANIARPHGIILITGPTGSGKTTTLYSILNKLNTTRVNISTLEDPVEYQIPGINQVQVNPAAGLTFAAGLRSFLRQDPNIILVGEIRDNETCNLAIQASLTGHLVFSTIHTNNAAGALPRLLDMDAEPFLVASTLNAVAGQRIVRKICADCLETFKPAGEVLADIKKVLGSLYGRDDSAVFLARGRGCAKCSQTGYLGRIGVYEVLPVSEKIAKMIIGRTTSADIEKEAVQEGMITMKQDGYLKILDNLTTIEEVLRVAQD